MRTGAMRTTAKKMLKALEKSLPRRELKFDPLPLPVLEWDYAPGDPRRDESHEAEARRRAPLPPGPPSDLELFLEQWYKDHPDCPRIDYSAEGIAKCMGESTNRRID